MYHQRQSNNLFILKIYKNTFYYPIILNNNITNLLYKNQSKYRVMCGNDISTIVVPNQSFLQQLRTQIATGKISIKNNPNNPQTQQHITINQISTIRRFDTTKLKQIQLIRCEITHQLLQEFMKSDWSNLKILSLNHNKIGPIGCRIIASCETLTSLKTLQLTGNKIKDAGVKALASSNFDLQDINLNDNGLTSEGIKSLKIFNSIEYLSLCGNSLKDQSIEHIKNINNNIVYLAISRNKFTNQGLRQLIPLKKLSVLLLDRNKITLAKTEVQAPNSLFLFY